MELLAISEREEVFCLGFSDFAGIVDISAQLGQCYCQLQATKLLVWQSAWT